MLLDPSDDLVQNASVPFYRFAATANAVEGVPTSAISLPRHLCICADVFNVQIAFLPAIILGRIVSLAFLVRAFLENRDQGFPRVTAG